jgi:hypothetical protein
MSFHEIITTALALCLLAVAGLHGWQDGKKNADD